MKAHGRFDRISAAVRPTTRRQLDAWLRLVVDVHAPTAPTVAGSQAPFDYLAHAFFEPGGAGVDRPAGGDCVVWANRGGGKTFFAAVATMLDLVFKPGIEVRILGGSLEQSSRMQRHLRRLFETPALSRLVDGRLTDRRVRLVNGSMCLTLAQSHTSVRGCRVQKIRCDEVELFDPEVWEAAQLVTRSKRCGDTLAVGAVEAFSTMHRSHGLMARIVDQARGPGDNSAAGSAARTLFRWGVVDVLERCEAQRACEPCALVDECGGRAKAGRGFISIDDAITLKRRSSQSVWQSEMLCQRPSRSDAVYPEFDRGAHVFSGERAPEAEDLVCVCGMDFGFRAPTVVLWAEVDADGVARVIAERSERGVVLDEHVRAIIAAPNRRPAWVGIDPAGRQRSDQTGISAATAMRRAGLVVRDRRLGVMEGVAMVRARLAPAAGGPRLFIHERCQTLIESLERYHFPSDRPESNEPVKDGFDHAVDALRYLIVNLDRPYTTTRWRYA